MQKLYHKIVDIYSRDGLNQESYTIDPDIKEDCRIL